MGGFFGPFVLQSLGQIISTSLFTAASQVWTPNPNSKQFIFLLIGDGGGGSGAVWSAAGSAGGGGGGGGAVMSYYKIPYSFAPPGATIVIGQGGAGGAAGAPGGNGTGSTFTWLNDPGGTDFTAGGGHGGPLTIDGKSINPGGAGGNSVFTGGGTSFSNVLLASPGEIGTSGFVIAGWGQGGRGGPAAAGFGMGRSANPTQTTIAGLANPASCIGAGGNGSVNLTAQTSAGANGSPGACMVWEFG